MNNNQDGLLRKDGVSLLVPFVMLTCCFALWGFANDVTNPMVQSYSTIFQKSNLEGSLVQVRCLFLCNGEDRLDFNVVMHHRVGHCESRQIFNGLLGGSSNAAFDGKIIVAPDAQKTEAYQESHNILLSEDARIDTRPQLEIYADDVKCSHGATVGRLNEEEQFYMRSRGIPEAEAKVLQMISFAAPIIRSVPDLASVIEEAIRSL